MDVLIGDARLLKEATTTIPIVSPTIGDPVTTGLVASLAHPGGNLTGLSAQSYDLRPKELELAKELMPRLTKIAFLFDTNDEPGAWHAPRTSKNWLDAKESLPFLCPWPPSPTSKRR